MEDLIVTPYRVITNTIFGTPGADFIDGTEQGDYILGIQGSDVIKGAGGDDFINGNEGNDLVEGGVGNDTLRGGKGNDTIVGEDGNDVIWGDRGTDILTGGFGNNIFILDNRDTANTSIETADKITDFSQRNPDTPPPSLGRDLLGLTAGMRFDDLVIFQGEGEFVKDTIIQDKVSGLYLAVLQGIDVNLIFKKDFVEDLNNLAPISAPSPNLI